MGTWLVNIQHCLKFWAFLAMAGSHRNSSLVLLKLKNKRSHQAFEACKVLAELSGAGGDLVHLLRSLIIGLEGACKSISHELMISQWILWLLWQPWGTSFRRWTCWWGATLASFQFEKCKEGQVQKVQVTTRPRAWGPLINKQCCMTLWSSFRGLFVTVLFSQINSVDLLINL